MTESQLIREAVAVFDDPARLEAVMSDLQSHGFDRADISFLAAEASGEGAAQDTRRIADNPAAPRGAPVSDTDVRQGRVLGTSLAAVVAGFAAAGFTVASGGTAAALGAAAAAAAAAGGAGAASEVIARKLSKDATDAQLASGGVLLWVRTPDPESEARALEILRRYSTQGVHLHTVPTEP
jgi:hypothetical protein